MSILKTFSNQLHLTLYVECSPGTQIEDAFTEAVALATRINILVRFLFNEVDCAAFPNGDVAMGVKEYEQNVKLTSPYKYAHARNKQSNEAHERDSVKATT
jgi:hypothetical protein